MRPATTIAALVMLSIAVIRDASAQTALRHYDVAAAPLWRAEMPVTLAEISGLAYTADGRLYAHGDEQAAVFRIDTRTRGTAERFGLAGKGGLLRGDFEDMQIVGDRVFLVSSTAVVYEGRLVGDGQLVDAIRRTRGLKEGCEVEGMTWDSTSSSLLLLCKQVKTKRWKDQVVILGVSTQTWRFEPEPRILVAEEALRAVTGAKRFNGSAIVRHPRTGTFLMVAGPQRAIAEIDATGRVLGGSSLDPRRHQQPEGLAIGPDMALLISDEAASQAATITAYAYRP